MLTHPCRPDFEASQGKRHYSRTRLAALLFTTHLTLVLYGASGSPFINHLNIVKPFWTLYGEVTAARHQYGFYAPRVGAPARIRVRVDWSNKPATEYLLNLKSLEGKQRLGYDDAFRNTETPDESRILMTSLAAAQFDAFPDAHSVTIIVECENVPEMQQEEQGTQPHWVLVFSSTFCRKP